MMQWAVWLELCFALFVVGAIGGLRMASDKAYAVEQRIDYFFANGGEIGGNVTFDNDVLIGGNLDGVGGTLFIASDVTMSGVTNLNVGNDVTVNGNLFGGSGGTLFIDSAVTISGSNNLVVGNDCSVNGNIFGNKVVNAVTNFVRNGTTLTVP